MISRFWNDKVLNAGDIISFTGFSTQGESESEEEVKPRRPMTKFVPLSVKKRRRLTDLDVEEDDDPSDEDFMNTR